MCYLRIVLSKSFQHILTMSSMGGCLIRVRNCVPLVGAWVHPRYFGRVCVAHLFSSPVRRTEELMSSPVRRRRRHRDLLFLPE